MCTTDKKKYLNLEEIISTAIELFFYCFFFYCFFKNRNINVDLSLTKKTLFNMSILNNVSCIFTIVGVSLNTIIENIIEEYKKRWGTKFVLIRNVTEISIKSVWRFFLTEVLALFGYILSFGITYGVVCFGEQILKWNEKLANSQIEIYLISIVLLINVIIICCIVKIEKNTMIKKKICNSCLVVDALFLYIIVLFFLASTNSIKIFLACLAILSLVANKLYITIVSLIYGQKNIKLKIKKFQKIRSILLWWMILQVFFGKPMDYKDLFYWIYAGMVFVETYFAIILNENGLVKILVLLKNKNIKISKGNIVQCYGDKIGYDLFNGTREIINMKEIKEIIYSYVIPKFFLKFINLFEKGKNKIILQTGDNDIYDSYRIKENWIFCYKISNNTKWVHIKPIDEVKCIIEK